MRFEGTSGQHYGEMEAEVVRLKMQRNGLEIERDSLKRCCEALESRLASLEAFAEAVRQEVVSVSNLAKDVLEADDMNPSLFIVTMRRFAVNVAAALAKLDGKE